MTILAFTGLLLIVRVSAQSIKSKNGYTVVIDAGHGGKDPGAVGGGYKEKDINLSVALKLGQLLEQQKDIKVVYTRKSDVFVELSDRTKISNNASANLFISIHANSAKRTTASGIETYVMGMEKSEANIGVATRENAVITLEDGYDSKYEGYDPSSVESYIVFALQQSAYQNESLQLAQIIQCEYVKNLNDRILDKGVKQANFLVLWKTAAPAILTEIGFISNQSDRAFIVSEKGQNIIAKSLCDAVLDYKEKYFTPVMVNDASTNKTGLEYKVQIMISDKMLPRTKQIFSKWKDRVEYIEVDNKFKYFIKSGNLYQETLSLRDSLRVLYPDCFIVPYYNGHKISVSEAKKLE